MFKSLFRSFGALIFLLLFTACQSNSSREIEDCPRGTPTPVYSLDYDFVKSHQFSKDGQESTEEIIFKDDLQLTISQSGCDKVRQVYSFTLESPTSAIPDSIWVVRSAEQFSKLAAYEEKFYSFNQWANKINQHKSEIKLTEAFEVDPGFYIQVDRIRGPKEVLLQVSLFEN